MLEAHGSPTVCEVVWRAKGRVLRVLATVDTVSPDEIVADDRDEPWPFRDADGGGEDGGDERWLNERNLDGRRCSAAEWLLLRGGEGEDVLDAVSIRRVQADVHAVTLVDRVVADDGYDRTVVGCQELTRDDRVRGVGGGDGDTGVASTATGNHRLHKGSAGDADDGSRRDGALEGGRGEVHHGPREEDER